MQRKDIFLEMDFDCDRARRRPKISSTTSWKLMEQTTTRNNWLLHWWSSWVEEWRRRRRLFAGRLYFWPITCQYRNIFTTRLTPLSAEKDCPPWTTDQGQFFKSVYVPIYDAPFSDIRLPKISWPWNAGERSLEAVGNDTIRKICYGFLLVFYNNFVPKTVYEIFDL